MTVDRSLAAMLEAAYRAYHRPEYIVPDPLQFLAGYPDPADQEIAGLIASSLALGRVNSIIKTVASVLAVIEEPRRYVEKGSRSRFLRDFRTFVYRFYTGEDMADFFESIQLAIMAHGTVRNAYASSGENLDGFVETFRGEEGRLPSMIADPAKGSCCKRLSLYLRWMIRNDRIDPGTWKGLSAGSLLVPIDTHMFRIGRAIGCITRRQPDRKAAMELTEAFRSVDCEDPVRFDFSLSRLGIRPELDFERWFRRGFGEAA